MTAYRTNRSAGLPGHPTQFAGAEPKPDAAEVELSAEVSAFDAVLREMAELNPVHWRLYMSPDDGPVVICVQEFDYPDYEPRRFLSDERFDSEAAAAAALYAMFGVPWPA